jgi:2Fe-2S ferredoxin
MPLISVTGRDGSMQQVEATPSMTLMEVLRDEGFEIAALCGGCCSCATCHVFVDPGFASALSPRTEDEALLLADSAYFRPEASRLSCQLRITDQLEGLEVTIAPAD